MLQVSRFFQGTVTEDWKLDQKNAEYPKPLNLNHELDQIKDALEKLSSHFNFSCQLEGSDT